MTEDELLKQALDQLKGLLKEPSNRDSLKNVVAVRDEPFEPTTLKPAKSEPDEMKFWRSTREQVGARESKWPLWIAAIGTIWMACTSVGLVFNKTHELNDPSWIGAASGLLNFAITHKIDLVLPWKGLLSVGFLTALLCFIFALLLWLFEVPPKHPDPLFGRMLREKFSHKKPLSRRFLRALLAEASFKDICGRAARITFPCLENGNEFSPEEQKAFVEQLFTFLNVSPQFTSYLKSHPGKSTIDACLLYELQYGARQMLFTAILNDLDFKYIYDEKLHQWRNWGARFAAIEWEKVVDQTKKFGEWLKKPTEKPESADKSPGLATPTLVTLVIVAVVVVYGTRRAEPPQTPQQKIALEWNGKEAFDQLSKSIAAVGVALGKLQPPGQPTTPPPSPIYVSSPPITITNPPVTATVVTSPATTLTAQSSPTTDFAPSTITHTSHDGPATPPKNPDHPERPDPKPQTPPQDGTERDDYFIFYPKSQKSTARNLTLNKASGHVCKYSADLKDPHKWLPDPLEIEVTIRDFNNSDECPKFNLYTSPHTTSNFTVGHMPIYSELLKAYIGVDEAKKRYFHLVGKNLIVLRVHYQAPPQP